MDKNISEQLKGFEELWKRVGGDKRAQTAANCAKIALMPGKNKRGSTSRFTPGHRG